MLNYKNLKTGDKELTSDIDKEVPGEVDIVKEKELKKESDLYKRELFTIIPSTHDPSLGIFPHDQQLSNSFVLLWNSIKTIPPLLIDSGYKVLKLKIESNSLIRNDLKSLGSGVYSLKYIPNTIPWEEVDKISFRN